MRILIVLMMVASCGGLAWDTTLPETPEVRHAMVSSVRTGETTETAFVTRWGLPTQKVHEGAEVRYIYRNMKNPADYNFPQFGNSAAFVIVRFQYGIAVGAYSSDIEGCRGTFPPRPPGPGFDNPTTVHPVNCGVAAHVAALHVSGQSSVGPSVPYGSDAPTGLTDDRYVPGGKSK